MLDLYKKVRDELLADSTITDLVGERIYMPFSPAGNTQLNYPFIVLDIDTGGTDSLTNDYRPSLMIHIWTKGSAKVSLGNQIEKQVLLNIDRKGFPTNDPVIFQILKDNATHIFDDDEQVYHKIVTFSVVMEGYGGSSHPCDGA